MGKAAGTRRTTEPVSDRRRDAAQHDVLVLPAAAGAQVVVHDVPLLAENGLKDMYDKIIVVDAPRELQIARLIASRKMGPGPARDRIAALASRKDRLAIADIVIDNTGSLADLDRRVDEVWAELVKLPRPGHQVSRTQCETAVLSARNHYG